MSARALALDGTLLTPRPDGIAAPFSPRLDSDFWKRHARNRDPGMQGYSQLSLPVHLDEQARTDIGSWNVENDGNCRHHVPRSFSPVWQASDNIASEASKDVDTGTTSRPSVTFSENSWRGSAGINSEGLGPLRRLSTRSSSGDTSEQEAAKILARGYSSLSFTGSALLPLDAENAEQWPATPGSGYESAVDDHVLEMSLASTRARKYQVAHCSSDEVLASAEHVHPCSYQGLIANWRDGGFVIDPRRNGGLLFWDSFICILAAVTALLVPYALVFKSHAVCRKFFKMQRAFDVFFLIDVCMRFFRVFRCEIENGYVRIPRVIAVNYFKTYFFTDVLGLLPVDILILRWPNVNLILLLLLRLANATRFSRQERKRYREVFGVSFIILHIPEYMCITLYYAHVVACLWAFVGQLDLNEGWICALKTTKGDSIAEDVDDMLGIQLYLRSLYWSVTTITAIGYGDITPMTDLEYGVCVVTMAVGAIMWIHAIGTICGVIDMRHKWNADQDSIMDDLERMIRSENLPTETSRELRLFFMQRHMCETMGTHLEMLESISPSLQAQVARSHIQGILDNAPYMRDICESPLVLMQCRRALRHTMFCAEEVMDLPQNICCLRRGLALKGMSVLFHGAVWGHVDALLTNPDLMDRAVPVAISFLEVLHLPKHSLDSMGVMFPHVKERLQKARLRCIMIRGMRFAAEQRLAGLDSGPRRGRKTGFSMRLDGGSDMLQAEATVDINHDVKEIVMQEQLARIHLSQDALNTKFDSLLESVHMLDQQPVMAATSSTWAAPIGQGHRRRAVAGAAAGAARGIQDTLYGFREKAAATTSGHLDRIVKTTTESGTGLAKATSQAAASTYAAASHGRAGVSALAGSMGRRFSLSPSRSKSLEVGPLQKNR